MVWVSTIKPKTINSRFRFEASAEIDDAAVRPFPMPRPKEKLSCAFTVLIALELIAQFICRSLVPF